MSPNRTARAYADEQILFDSVNEFTELSFAAYDPLVNSLQNQLQEEMPLKKLLRRVEDQKFDMDFLQAMSGGVLFGLQNSFILGADQIYTSLGITKTIALKDGLVFDWNLYDSRARSWMNIQAMTIAGVENLHLLESVKGELAKAIASGDSFNQWRDNLGTLFDRAGVTRLGRFHAYTVFQTNMHGAYNAGRFYAMNDPEISDEFPLWEYMAIIDDDTRPSHKAMNEKKFHRDDPIWLEWYPPNGFNCRCMVLPVHQSEGESASNWQPIDRPDTGWESNPALTTKIFERWTESSLKNYGLTIAGLPGKYDLPGIKNIKTLSLHSNDELSAAVIQSVEGQEITAGITLSEASQITLQNPAEVWGWMGKGNAQRMFIRPFEFEGKRQYGQALVENLELKDFTLSGKIPSRKGVLLYRETE